ncbi:class I SAM-dependent RNA methyltransferase [Thermocrinis minervae]|uniref:23S rRNA (Uracil1939-C5)-methyltransferase n=1 Tax=Thermocrinis minervae TaxID=381751 RepID=A0A1M6S532_9AQUI|nr:class I SAM-dependent RNA methyltransferase [Thermocrinis minervae]SHK39853.1 23S rRNA (uracil1939-C5)-methyltransferase [Thermocrinis minervae]
MEELTLDIEKLVHGGYGLATYGGKKVFVRYALPGERVKAQVIKEKKDYIEAQAVDIILPSAYRVDPPCPYYGFCGGCQLQHLEYGQQLEQKKLILLEDLYRIGGIREELQVKTVASASYHYRIRVQFKVKDGRLGFFKPQSNELIEISECMLCHSEINALVPSLKEVLKKAKDVQEIHVLYSPTEDEFLVKLVGPMAQDKDTLRKLMEGTLPKRVVGLGDFHILSGKLIKRSHVGREFTFIKVGNYTYRVSNESFFQVNHTTWEKLIEEAIEGAYGRALELYSGVGFFSLPLSEKVEFLTAGEMNPTSVKDAQYSARLIGRSNITFVHSPSKEILKDHAGELVDFVLVDPPRTGLTGEELKLLLQMKPTRINYVSCNTSTLARDLSILVKGGYSIRGITLVDNFPQTYHIESVVRLEFKGT